MFHTLAWILGGIALIGLLVALYVDRSRGRRRCPHCWFDLSSHGRELKCPECGRTHAHEGRMYLTRRHWKWAVLCVVGLVAARATWEYPTFKAKGAPAYAPDWAVRRFMGHLPALGPKWMARYEATLTPEVTKPEWKAIIERCLDVVEDAESSPQAKAWAASILGRIQSRAYFMNASGSLWANMTTINDLGPEGVARAAKVMTNAMGSDDPALRTAAATTLENLRDEAAGVGLPRLIAALRAKGPADAATAWTNAREHTMINAMLDNPEPVRKALIDDGDTPLPSRIAPLAAIDAQTSDAERARIIAAFVDDPDVRVRVLAYWMMGYTKVEADAAGLIARAAKDADGSVRGMAPWLATRFKQPPEVTLDLARTMLGDAEPAVRSEGVSLVQTMKDDAAPLAPTLLAMVKNDSAWYVRRNAAMALARIKDVDDATLLAAAESVVLDPQEDVQMYAGELLKRLGDDAASLAPALIASVGDPKRSVGARMKAIDTLAAVAPNSNEAYAAILAVATTPAKPPQARYAAVRVLPVFTAQKDATIAALTPLLKDEDSTLRRVARTALQSLGVTTGLEGDAE